jgi:hypothetical protein
VNPTEYVVWCTGCGRTTIISEFERDQWTGFVVSHMACGGILQALGSFDQMTEDVLAGAETLLDNNHKGA